MKVWLNGKIVDETKAVVSVFDRSYLHGEGAFETLRCYNERPAFLTAHFERLLSTAQTLGLKFPLAESDLESAIRELLQANHLHEAVVRFTLSAVGTVFGVSRPKEMPTNISIYAIPSSIDPKLYETGVKVIPIHDFTNDAPQIAGMKSTSYLTKMIARMKASENGAYEALLKNRDGFWTEGSRTNFFIVKERILLTPPLSDGLLPGITRQNVLNIAQKNAIPLREVHITSEDLKSADEIFLTGSGTEIMPVCEVIGLCKKAINKKSLTQKIYDQYNQLKLGSASFH